ncbi:MAG: DNA translocase FtsK 4TM domain-containing protein [Negativicutes bacterium]|jgi:S-DNA-T family DNA segregation ATPase FtsK/SpoIIIE
MFKSIPEKVKYETIGILFAGMSIFLFMTLLPINTGPVGTFFRKVLLYGIGIGSYLFPILIFAIGIRYMAVRKAIRFTVKFWAIVSVVVLSLALYHGLMTPEGQELLPNNFSDSAFKYGGVLSGVIVLGLRKLLGVAGSNVLLACFDLAAVMLATTWSLTDSVIKNQKKLSKTVDLFRETSHQSTKLRKDNETQITGRKPLRAIFDVEKHAPEVFSDSTILIQDQLPFSVDADEEKEETKKRLPKKKTQLSLEISQSESSSSPYKIPQISLLNAQQRVKVKSKDSLTEAARLLEDTLLSFGVEARVVHISNGPTVTRFELQPASGVKVSRITNLADDIALKFAVGGVRIEAPIPGKAAIGIEVPNRTNDGVCLREIIESNEYQASTSPLTVGLGKDIAGNIVITDLAKMPHLLVAGSTGSGKSVCINAIISSILFKSRPDEVKFIMIDPKMVELTNYNGIPHLLVPVVTDAERASAALRWAVQEMDKRYSLFANAGTRDIKRYNELTEEEMLPLVVIIIDELADLMMVAPVDVEDAICRLAQKARAAGIHLVLATQRPSVDVITGTIRNNIPSRIAFAVSSQIDSRVILDSGGAEKLLGRGDMLFSPVGASKPLRVQGVYVADDELAKIIDDVKTTSQPEYKEEVATFLINSERQKNKHNHNAEDPLYRDEYLERAVQIIMEYGSASTSLLQRKLGVGYSRAARLIDTLEEMKIISTGQGSKAREIIMPPSEVYEKYFNEENAE